MSGSESDEGNDYAMLGQKPVYREWLDANHVAGTVARARGGVGTSPGFTESQSGPGYTPPRASPP